jgi:hypothetical protein
VGAGLIIEEILVKLAFQFSIIDQESEITHTGAGGPTEGRSLLVIPRRVGVRNAKTDRRMKGILNLFGR